MTAQTQYKVYAHLSSGIAWHVATFDNELDAKRCADKERGAAYVRKMVAETVYRNKSCGPDSTGPL